MSDAVRRRWILAAASLGFAVVQLDVSVVNVAIKPIGDELGGSVASLQWIVNAYTITFAAFILSAGALGDRVGAKKVLLGAFCLFGVASVACGLAPSTPVLIVARLVQGVGAAALIPGSLSLLSHTFQDPSARAKAVGIWAMGASAALSAGPLVGGLLIATLGWRAIFFINVPLAVVGIVAIAACATETTRSHARRIDLPGQAAAILSLALIVGAAIEGGQLGFAQPLVLGGILAGLLLAVVFVLIERRSPGPMLPLDMFESPAFGASVGLGALLNIGTYGLLFVFSLFFQDAQHASPLLTGLAFLPLTGATMLMNALSSRISDRLGARFVLVAGSALIGLAALSLLWTGAATSYLAFLVPFLALGAGLGVIVPVLNSVALASVDKERSGIASGTLNTARQTGSALGVAVFGALIGGGALAAGLRLDLAITAALAVAMILIARRVPVAVRA